MLASINARIVSSAPFHIWMRAGGRTQTRSGGGGGFSRSSGGSSGSFGGGSSTSFGGGSSGGGGGIGVIIVLAIIGIAGYFIWSAIKKGKMGQAGGIAAGAGGLVAAGVAASRAAQAHNAGAGAPDNPGGLAKIIEHDPGFDETGFMSSVERCFFLTQKAWCDQDPDVSRQVMADGIWQTHKTQIDDLRAAGRKDVMENLAVEKCTIVSADSNATKDTIVVLVEAHAKDYQIDVKSGKKMSGNDGVETWGERWTFQRASSATTKADGGTLSQKCPNCGAPLKVDLAGVCGYCKANIMAGNHDWVLVKIDDE